MSGVYKMGMHVLTQERIKISTDGEEGVQIDRGTFHCHRRRGGGGPEEGMPPWKICEFQRLSPAI